MKTLGFAALLAVGGLSLAAHAAPAASSSAPAATAQTPVSTPAQQAPAAAPGMQVHTSDYGFSNSIPSDWEIVDTRPMLPVVQQQQTQTTSSEDEKKGIACVQITMLARHGAPPSVIEAMVLPFDCFGQTFTDQDLASFAGGVAQGMKKIFEIHDPVFSAYKLGTHSVWIERAGGTYIDRPEVKRTLETVCTLLKKGAVCWMALAADVDALQTFEHGAVTLEGDAPAMLVPENTFQKKQ